MISHTFSDSSRGTRIQKVLAEAGVASRRHCEVLIQEGRVRVNGQLITNLPAWVDPKLDSIHIDGVLLRQGGRTWASNNPNKTYLMVHKPKGVICSTAEPEGRRLITDLVDRSVPARIYPVGRLDADSTGLVLLTDDGELSNRLTHPRYQVSKQYLVSVKGKLGQEELARLRRGLFLTDRSHSDSGPRRTGMQRVQIMGQKTDRSRFDRTTLTIELREGRNREIRRLLARLGFRTRKLKRTAIGPLKLKGLAPGQWRHLTTLEVRQLKKVAKISDQKIDPSKVAR